MPNQTSKAIKPKLLPTPDQVQGPYLLENAPLRTYCFPEGATDGPFTNPIQRIFLRGQVLNTNGQPIKDAIVDFWVADPDGIYDNQDENSNPLPLPTEKHKYRCRMSTDENAFYFVHMLRPGNYPLDDKGNMRPAHIHVRIKAPGYKTKVTQLYLIDDPYNSKDLKDHNPKTGKSRRKLFFQPELVIHLWPALPPVNRTEQQGVFNFVLTRAYKRRK